MGGVGGVGGAHMCTCVHRYMHVMGDVTLQECKKEVKTS